MPKNSRWFNIDDLKLTYDNGRWRCRLGERSTRIYLEFQSEADLVAVLFGHHP